MEHVVPRFYDHPNMRWLESGVYEGKSVTWTLDHILTRQDARIYCLDLFDSELPYLATWAPNTHYEEVFDANINGDERVVKLKGKSEEILPGLANIRLHGAYLDSEHTDRSITAEAACIWNMLLPGGVLVFDDYGYEAMPEAKVAIDRFLGRADVHKEILHLGFQAIVLKTE